MCTVYLMVIYDWPKHNSDCNNVFDRPHAFLVSMTTCDVIVPGGTIFKGADAKGLITYSYKGPKFIKADTQSAIFLPNNFDTT